MTQTTNASAYEVEVERLLNALIIKTDEVERCQYMLDKVSMLDMNSKLPVEVVDYIGSYANICMVDTQGMISDTKDVLSKILSALFKAIAWIIEKLTEIFKYIFNSQYRAKKETLDLQRKIITLSLKPEFCNKFENTNVSVVTKADVDKLIYTTERLFSLMHSCAGVTELQYSDTLINQWKGEAAIDFDSEGKMYDATVKMVPQRNTTFGMAGWKLNSNDGIQNSIVQYLAMIDGVEDLKALKKNTDRMSSDLKKRAEAAVTSGATSGNVSKLQKETATKIEMVKILAYAAAIAVRRSHNLLAFFNLIYEEMVKIAQSK